MCSDRSLSIVVAVKRIKKLCQLHRRRFRQGGLMSKKRRINNVAVPTPSSILVGCPSGSEIRPTNIKRGPLRVCELRCLVYTHTPRPQGCFPDRSETSRHTTGSATVGLEDVVRFGLELGLGARRQVADI